MFVDWARSGPLSSLLFLFFFFFSPPVFFFFSLSPPIGSLSSLSRGSQLHGSHGVDTQGDNINIMSRFCARQCPILLSKMLLFGEGTRLGWKGLGPPSFIRGYTAIFMGHMKNEVRAFITASSRPFLGSVLPRCRRNRRWCASQYFGTRFRGRDSGIGGRYLESLGKRKDSISWNFSYGSIRDPYIYSKDKNL